MRDCIGRTSLAVALWLGLGPASAQGRSDPWNLRQNIPRCNNENNAYSPDLAIIGCNTVILHGRLSDKNRAIVFYRRAVANKAKGDLDRAFADYDVAILLDPTVPLYFYNRGSLYLDKGGMDRAIARYNEAIRLDPKYASAFIGIAYAHKKDDDHAIADYDEAICLDPKYAAAFNGRGKTYLDRGDFDRAIADIDEAIRLDPKFAYAYNLRGIAHEKRLTVQGAVRFQAGKRT